MNLKVTYYIVDIIGINYYIKKLIVRLVIFNCGIICILILKGIVNNIK